MKNMLDRRGFIGLGTAFTLAGCKSWHGGVPAITSVRSPNSLLSHACIGTANMAMYDIKKFLAVPNLKITALCDVDAAFLAVARKLVPDARIYADWRELLEAEGDRLDSLNVSTPDHTHAIISANAMRKGRHVYCQKPLCKYMDESRLLRDVAAESGVATQLGTQIAAGTCDRTAVEALRAGTIGPVKRVIMFSTRNGGSRSERTVPVAAPVPETLDWDKWLGPAPERPYAPDYHPLMWRKFTDFGSGWVGDLCIHLISCVWQGLDMGATMPLAVHADVNAEALANPAYKGCWPRYSHITWEFPGVKASGGKPFTMEWFSGMSDAPAAPAEFLPPEICREAYRKCGIDKLPYEGRVIEGETGYLLVPHGFGPELKPLMAMKGSATAPDLPGVPPAPNHFEEFAEMCRSGGKTRSGFEWTTWMTDAVLLGCVAERLPRRRHVWNNSTRSFDTAEATAVLKSSYRRGWELDGLGRL